MVEGRIVGAVERTTFTKRVHRSKHFHRNLQAWGHDSSNWAELYRQSCRLFQVFDLESGSLCQTTLQIFLTRGTRHDFGFSPQVFLHERHWTVSDPRQADLFAPAMAMATG